MEAGEEEKKSEILRPHPSGPPFAPSSLQGTNFQSPTFSGSWPHPLGPHNDTHTPVQTDWPKMDWPKLAKSGLAKVSLFRRIMAKLSPQLALDAGLFVLAALLKPMPPNTIWRQPPPTRMAWSLFDPQHISKRRERIGLCSVIRHISGTSYSCHAAENHAILKRIRTQSVVLLCRSRHQSLLAVVGYASVPRDTSLSELKVATRSLASALGCETTVTVIGLCAHGVLYGDNKSIVRELTVTSGIDSDTIHELLFAQSQQISSSDRPTRTTRERDECSRKGSQSR